MSRDAVRHLSSDPVFAALIGRVGPPRLAVARARSPYEALIRAIAHQQLHGRAAEAILARFTALFPAGRPSGAAVPPEDTAPEGTVREGAVPEGAVPEGAVPEGTLSAGNLPPGTRALHISAAGISAVGIPAAGVPAAGITPNDILPASLPAISLAVPPPVPAALFPTPDQVLATDDAALRACGFSASKIAAVRDICAKTLDGTVPTRRASTRLSDAALIDRLTTIRGVGRWTVEMLLIFTLGRPDVLPVDDFGVREGYRTLFGLPAQPRPRELAQIGLRWAPYRSLATWYLYRASEEARRQGAISRA